MRYVIIAVLLYLFYLIARSIIRNLAKKNSRKQDESEQKTKRTYNIDQVQDAEFREVKKD